MFTISHFTVILFLKPSSSSMCTPVLPTVVIHKVMCYGIGPAIVLYIVVKCSLVNHLYIPVRSRGQLWYISHNASNTFYNIGMYVHLL